MRSFGRAHEPSKVTDIEKAKDETQAYNCVDLKKQSAETVLVMNSFSELD